MFFLARADKMVNPAIEVRDLVKRYGDQPPILDGISFAVESAEFAIVYGKSGCGKSTLLNMIGGLDAPTSGDIRIEGESIVGLSQDRLARMRLDKIGFVFQDYNLLADETVKENITLPLELSRKAVSKDADFLMRQFGIIHVADKLPNQISGGEAQRVAIARAMMNEPRVILADEPTGNLDSENSEGVIQAFQMVREQFGTTVVLATHDDSISRSATVHFHLEEGHVQIAKR